MQKPNKSLVLKLALVTIAVVIAVGAIVLWYALREKPVDGEKSVVLVITTHTLPEYSKTFNTDTEYLFDFLMEINEAEQLKMEYTESEWGKFVDSFFGVVGDGTYYMLYFKAPGGDWEMSMVGATQTVLTDGYSYRFILE